MLEITLKNLEEEVRRAEAERIADQQKFSHSLPDPNTLPDIHYVFSTTDDKHTSILTCQNQRPEQQDRAGAMVVDIDPAASVIDRALILFNTFAVLSHCLKDEKAGSTLVLNLSWHSENTVHVLVANVGDSRSILVNPTQNTVTRLTCDHTLLRKNERDSVVSRGYALIEQCKNLIVREEATNKIVASQVGSYLRPAVENPGGLQMTRSMGDTYYHSKAKVFTTIPSLSYTTAPKTERCYLFSCSDGITDFVSDEDVARILRFNHDRSAQTKLLRITQTAILRGSKDNLTCMMSSLRHEIPTDKMRLDYVADGHSGIESAEFIHSNMEKSFILATRLHQQYRAQKAALMPRELRYLENILRFTESGLVTLTEGIECINSFHWLEKLCKRVIKNSSTKSFLFNNIPHSVMNDKAIKDAFDSFRSGHITATEAIFLFLKRLSTIQVPDDHRELLFNYRKNKVVLCDPKAPNFIKGIDDSASVIQGIGALMDVITKRLTNQQARIEKILKK